MRSPLIVGAALVTFWFTAVEAEAGKLSRARQAVRGADEKDENEEHGQHAQAGHEAHEEHSSSDRQHHDHHHGILDLSLLFCSSASESDPVWPLFPSYPYADGIEGYLAAKPSISTYDWSSQFQFETGSDFDGLDRLNVSLLVENSQGTGLDFDWNSYRENLSGGGYDDLHVGELNLLYRIAESEQGLCRVGVGVGWLDDALGTELGMILTMKSDYMPCRPFVFSSEIDLGTLGDAEMFHGSLSLGVMLERFELFGGYDYRTIGPVELQGPMVGLRIWF